MEVDSDITSDFESNPVSSTSCFYGRRKSPKPVSVIKSLYDDRIPVKCRSPLVACNKLKVNASSSYRNSKKPRKVLPGAKAVGHQIKRTKKLDVKSKRKCLDLHTVDSDNAAYESPDEIFPSRRIKSSPEDESLRKRKPLVEQVIPRERPKRQASEMVAKKIAAALKASCDTPEEKRGRKKREPRVEQVIPRERPKRQASEMVAEKIAAALKASCDTPEERRWRNKRMGKKKLPDSDYSSEDDSDNGSEHDSDNSKENDSDNGSDYSFERRNRYKNRYKKPSHTIKKITPDAIGSPKYSDYEKAAHERLASRMEFLKSLKIFQDPDED